MPASTWHPKRHVLARLDEEGAPIGKSTTIAEDREGYAACSRRSALPPALVVMEATGQDR